MKKIKYLAIIACVLLCGTLILTCEDDTIKIIHTPIDSEGWTWEVIRDDFPVQFAEGISTLNGVAIVPDEFFQTYTLIDAYVKGNPNTGRVLLTTDNEFNMEMPVMKDAIGYNKDLVWPANKETGDPIPKRVPVPKKVMGPHGFEVDVAHIYGTLLQRGSENDDHHVQRTGNFNDNFSASSPSTDYRFCASWPTISLYATPTLEALKKFREDGYGFTFWVKVNKSYMLYSVSIENWGYRSREAYEPKHYFGLVPGREPDVSYNYTRTEVGEWKQIKVIYDPEHPDHNMEVAQWTMMYGIQGMYPNDPEPSDIDFDLNKMVRIIWDISLPNNGGIEGTEFQENTISTGKHEYDVYFYGLQFLHY